MELSGFFGSINGDRRYRSMRWARYFAKFIGNGVYAREANQLQVVAGEGMQIIVRPGAAFINGYDYENTSDLKIDLENADGVLNRIVRVVIQWNLIERKISAVVRYSPFATNPTAPALQRTPDIFELGRADVFIGRGVTRITQSAITDHLLNTSLCGVVAVLGDQLNTEHFDAQLKAWFEEFTEESLRAFLDWFNLIKDLLGEDSAGKIMNFIQAELNLIYYIIAPNKLTDIQRNEIESNGDLMAIVNSSFAVPPGVITMWSGAQTAIPIGWALCDGENGTPNLRDRFIIGAGGDYEVGDVGGEESVSLTQAEMPRHGHIQNSHSHSVGLPGTLATDVLSLDGTAVQRRSIGTNITRLTHAQAFTARGATATNQFSGGEGIAQSASDGAAHENRPPYYALCYIMKLPRGGA